ncbi:hypothetical protein ACPZ57_10930 [Acinetobacter baumannii]|uniref:hypothetical protein n=1 Tax=Acinetobacter baumannii TaxID=470 RepID=UPI001021B463|nr:hypothetical protein [Acinetobacter baumannii]MDC5446039.1 hypothetical protein [Acinetobacter baumannii]RYL12814.1 hypothetical protein EWO92_20365 [Acinetobacter baumannii]RYL25026.1 hypothetical protein EWO96_20300 [Acinetobacter baumannii]RYL40772.1 hypothetical protein EWP49_20350 [Acinetobacter baumannii]HAV2809512.1 hypothetical protein [Acinetobacter baumannii]
MNNIIQFPKADNSKQEIQNILRENLLEQGATTEDVNFILERMTSFLDIICDQDFSQTVPPKFTKEELDKLMISLQESIFEFTNKLLLERVNAESFYLKGD